MVEQIKLNQPQQRLYRDIESHYLDHPTSRRDFVLVLGMLIQKYRYKPIKANVLVDKDIQGAILREKPPILR
jgi:hypothetical protein